MSEIPGPVGPSLWLAVILAAAITVATTAWKRIRHADEVPNMDWMDWCGHYALTGILTLIVAGILNWMALALAGMLLLLPLYPLAILGLLGRFEELISELIRAFRRR